jgi:hypothetical protein
MSDVYHVIVQKSDGTIARSDKEKESSAIKSAKMYVNVRGETAAVVIVNGRIAFSIPEGTEQDEKFIKIARKKASEGTEAAAPVTKAHSKPKEKKESAPVSDLDAQIANLATDYEKAMKDGDVSPPVPKTRPASSQCNTKVLEAACTAYLIGAGLPANMVKKVCANNDGNINTIAADMNQGKLTQDEAIKRFIAILQGKLPMTPTKPAETTPSAPGINVNKILRSHKGSTFTPSRFREDLGMTDPLEALLPLTLPDGITIYTTKESDPKLHAAIAFSMGYTPESLINPHNPSPRDGYDYQRLIPLTRPTAKNPTWRGMGERIAAPGTLVKRIRDEFKPSDVLVEVAQGVELE